MKEKLKSYSFWVGLIASIMLVVKFVAESFGLSINEESIDTVVNSILGILTVFGVINKPKEKIDSNENVDNVDDKFE